MPASGLPDLNAPLAVACHDAGAANLIFAWLRALAKTRPEAATRWRIAARGPAGRLWRERPLPGVEFCDRLEDVLSGAAMLLSGTGWGSDLEHEARVAAKARGIASVAVLDHWVNYRERFVRGGVTQLPDRILVADEQALDEARRCFPAMRIDACRNVYLEEAVRDIRPLAAQANEVLYLLGPLHADRVEDRPDEIRALEFFAGNIDRVLGGERAGLRLRPHPSDVPDKYLGWIAAHRRLDARLDDSATLAEGISRARWVAGTESYAMVVALAAGRTVVSTLPPGAHRCRLPFSQIVQLRDLVAVPAREAG